MFSDGEYQVFGSELLDSDCTLPPPTTNSATTSANNGTVAYSATQRGHRCDDDLKRILENLLLKVNYLEKEISRFARHERRFDQLDIEMARQSRLEKMERDLHKVVQNTSNLQAELRSFAVDITSRIKQVEVYPPQTE